MICSAIQNTAVGSLFIYSKNLTFSDIPIFLHSSYYPFAAPAVTPFTKYFWKAQKIASAGTIEMIVPANTISHLAEYWPTNPAISTVMVFAFPLGNTRYGIR